MNPPPLPVSNLPPPLPPSLAPLSTEEEDVEVADDAKDLLTKIGVETSLRYEQWLKYRQL